VLKREVPFTTDWRQVVTGLSGLITMGGVPGMGRTAVCLPLHFYAAFQNGTVAFESAEIRVNCLLMDAGETCGKGR